jgi:transposase
MKSIERKDTGEDWKEYLQRLAEEAGIENPTEEDLRRFDKKRTDKKASNDDWQSPSDPDSRIAKMKDGRTHLAYKAEHVVDLDSDLVLAAVVYEANRDDTETLAESVVVAQKNIIEADSLAAHHEAFVFAVFFVAMLRLPIRGCGNRHRGHRDARSGSVSYLVCRETSSAVRAEF